MIMHTRSLSGKVGAGIIISCGIFSLEIEVTIELSSVLVTALQRANTEGSPCQFEGARKPPPVNPRPPFLANRRETQAESREKDLSPRPTAQVQAEEDLLSPTEPIPSLFGPEEGEGEAFILQLFNTYDRDKSGDISIDEFDELTYELGHKLTKEELHHSFQKIAKQNPNRISYTEFKDWWQSDNKLALLHEIGDSEREVVSKAIKYFKKFDLKKNGSLDKFEFKKVYKQLYFDKLTKKDFESAFQELDKDKSGTISLNEYVQWLVNI
eukprot:TRINITY_DN8003_c0_g1_i1.p1 TRINITY_DN8003_c0_g1~~TRINITY_DN8003_c0_g1_i1.p1  ORF type:complete len:268 (-),score=56.86 TRINITY_DN8003_c0_g1_i1:61-864(-)